MGRDDASRTPRRLADEMAVETSDSGWQEVWHEDCDWSEPEAPWYVDAHDFVLNPVAPAAHLFTLLVLHSCSGGPDDIIEFFHRLHVSFRNNIRVVVPCAPVRRENHYGYEKDLNSWFEYDGESEDGNSPKSPEQVSHQCQRILSLVESERLLLPNADPRRLILWGLSQGAGLAVDVALRASCKVGGVIALRGMALPVPLDLPARSLDAPLVDVFAFNGERDWLCPPDAAKASYEALKGFGIDLRFESHPSLAHGCARGKQILCWHELRRVGDFLRQVWADM